MHLAETRLICQFIIIFLRIELNDFLLPDILKHISAGPLNQGTFIQNILKHILK